MVFVILQIKNFHQKILHKCDPENCIFQRILCKRESEEVYADFDIF